MLSNKPKLKEKKKKKEQIHHQHFWMTLKEVLRLKRIPMEEKKCEKE